jgi:nucleoside-diphosphate-sugar epimerase
MVEALQRLMESDLDALEPVNLGNPEERTIGELLDLIRSHLPAPIEVRHLPLPIDDPRRRRPDIARAESRLGWRPSTPLVAGLHQTIAWFQTELGRNERRQELPRRVIATAE